jgi:hypothetical protein
MRATCLRSSDYGVAVSPSIAFQRKSGTGFLISLCVAPPTRSASHSYRDVDFYGASNDRASNFNLNRDTDAATNYDLHACACSDT